MSILANNKGEQVTLESIFYKEFTMKKLAYLMLVALLSITLAACATHKNAAGAKVKCPACGYEFQAPDTPGN